MAIRQERLQSIFLKEITDIIQNGIKNPGLGFVTISDVTVSKDLSHCKIFVSFLGKKERNNAGLKVLEGAKGYIRSELAKRVKVYKVPELHFIIDDSLEKARRIDAIIDSFHK